MNTYEKKQSGYLSAFILKLIAAAAMLTDHLAVVFFDSNYAMRSIGRLAFPIFAFFIAEGYTKTRDVKKYGFRLLLFSLIAQAPYVLAFGDAFYRPNVIFTLFLGLLAIYAYDKSDNIIRLAVPMALALAAEYIGSDHGAFGVIMVLIFYAGRKKEQKIAGGAFLIIMMQAVIYLQRKSFDRYTFQFMFYLMPLIPIYFYSGQKGVSLKFTKWLFYAFYPLHLLIIWLVSLIFT